ncbi:MAG: sporulation membrane protein YtaF [Firmicutes bacterium]|nr:sporulation membrane protein YtaF [Bacillota bacterium]
MLAVLLLAVGISLDGFIAGVTYGLRKVRMPLTSVGIASLISGAAVFLSMQAGHIIGVYLNGALLPRLGALLLIGLGGWNVVQGSRSAPLKTPTAGATGEDTIFRFRLQPFGLVIQILREPMRADLDASGTISSWEAILLGTALALDAMAVGLAASMVGFPLIATCLSVVAVSFIALNSGLFVGRLWAKDTDERSVIWRYLPGSILIVIGLWWLLTAGR